MVRVLKRVGSCVEERWFVCLREVVRERSSLSKIYPGISFFLKRFTNHLSSKIFDLSLILFTVRSLIEKRGGS